MVYSTIDFPSPRNETLTTWVNWIQATEKMATAKAKRTFQSSYVKCVSWSFTCFSSSCFLWKLWAGAFLSAFLLACGGNLKHFDCWNVMISWCQCRFSEVAMNELGPALDKWPAWVHRLWGRVRLDIRPEFLRDYKLWVLGLMKTWDPNPGPQFSQLQMKQMTTRFQMKGSRVNWLAYSCLEAPLGSFRIWDVFFLPRF